MPTFFERLRAETELERQGLSQIPQITDALRGAISRDTYIAFLEQAYHHVRCTVPLMMAAGSRLSHQQEYLCEALVEYVKEEVGHQDRILSDISYLGGDAEAVRHGKPNFATEVMVAYAFDSVCRINPVSFFGMVFVLEGTSTALATKAADAIRQSLRLSKDGFSYLYSHGTLDLEHMKFFEQLVNRIPEEPNRQAIIHMSKRMFRLYGNVFRSIPHISSQVQDVA
ncbi:MAG: iron-containing redox enzyme family protein [Nitrospirales bacterium]|nr:iron-containing redox enzyme family protein [Nitrospira sp.]MCB9710204.1 iron-containing redox enzyme family protein [Nitrospiraceae bacterium]MDR4488307.1 iron-containing redox enzyme family protein [Nitrospirales bacterium]